MNITYTIDYLKGVRITMIKQDLSYGVILRTIRNIINALVHEL